MPNLEIEQLRAALERRTREWQDEQASRIAAEQATIAADKRARDTERLADALREEMRRFANRLDHIPFPRDDTFTRTAVHQAAAQLRTIADLTAAAAGKHVLSPPMPDVPRCRVCGCTEDAACPGGCWWIPDPTGQGDLCNRCAGAVARVTIEDLENGERTVRGVPAGNYFIATTEPCTYEIAAFLGGFHRITVSNVQDPENTTKETR